MTMVIRGQELRRVRWVRGLLVCVSLLGALGCRSSGLTKEQVQAKRLERQQGYFWEFDKCPSCFVSRIQGADRTFLFDAVVDCRTSLRVGTWSDGGKWVCDPDRLGPSPIVYSFGVGNEISFDREMASTFGAQVYMFDPTPSVSQMWTAFKAGQAEDTGRIFFHALGLGPVSEEAGKQRALTLEGQVCPVKTLREMAELLGHTHVDIVKLDIEGGEFASLKQMIATSALPALGVKQVLVEVHLWSDRAFEDLVRIVRGLADQGYLLFHKELNPGCPAYCEELAFVQVAQ